MDENNPVTEKIEQTLDELSDKPCVLCGGYADLFGCYCPRDPEKEQDPEYLANVLFYSICSECMAKPDTDDRVGAILELMVNNGLVQ